jgi:capsid protein
LRSEDAELISNRKSTLVATTRDLPRNMSAFAWGIRKHLDYVSRFHFQPKSGDDNVDKQLEFWMGIFSNNCDQSGRHDLPRLLRLIEKSAFGDGDCFIVKRNTGKLQVIESDRIRNPINAGMSPEIPVPDDGQMIDGVILDTDGAATGYCLHKRLQSKFNTGMGFIFERVLDAKYTLHHGYFDRIDQVRGISPAAAAINVFQDILEAQTFALIKAKITSLFGLKINRAESDTITDINNSYKVDLEQGAFFLDMQNGDNAEFMESGHPSTSFQEYMVLMLQAGLKSIDLPYCFYDESTTTYTSGRQALIQYNSSCNAKRQNLKRILDDITFWKVQEWIADGKIKLPPGWTIYDVKWNWVAAGIPWVDPLKEINAGVIAVNACLDSRQRICKEGGDDWFEIVQELKQEQDLITKLGLNPSATPMTLTINEGNNGGK